MNSVVGIGGRESQHAGVRATRASECLPVSCLLQVPLALRGSLGRSVPRYVVLQHLGIVVAVWTPSVVVDML